MEVAAAALRNLRIPVVADDLAGENPLAIAPCTGRQLGIVVWLCARGGRRETSLGIPGS